MRIATVTFGCRLNRAETDDFERLAQAAGCEIVGLDRNPEAIFVRGCSVTAKAQKDSERAIAKLRRDHPDARVATLGCLPGRDAKDAIEALFDAPAQKPAVKPSNPHSRAFLKIQDGCNASCTYCIVPQFRGKSQSVPAGEVLARARQMLDDGFREIVVTACNAMDYRSGEMRLAGLVAQLAALNGAEHRVRLGSIEPGMDDGNIADLFRRIPNLCKFLHLSVQSASDPVLKAMRRPYDAAKLAKLCEAFRQAAGEHATLGADAICGFPGESDEDFEKTRRFLEEWNFTNVHAFPFSERPGTPASEAPGKIPPPIRARRARILIDDAAKRRSRQIELFKSREVEICIEKPGEDYSEGWTGEYLRAKVPGFHPKRSLVKVRSLQFF